MKTGAAYVRVSTEEQAEFSPDSQIKKIREYAACHEILLPDKFIFLDEGISGRHAEKRPAFMKMIGTARQKPRPFDMILLWKFSRFARNRQDSILYKSMLRKECGIDVISITEQLSDDPTAILIEALLEAMDEYYSINLAQEVKRGMNEKFSRGGVVSAPPFGYRMGKDRFEIDTQNAPLIRMIYQDFLNGLSYRRIAAKLNDMGVRSIHGNPFQSRSVEYILSNPVYTGKLRRSLNGSNPSDRFRRNGNITLVTGEHPPLITEETYHAAQERINDIQKAHPKNAHSTSRAPQADFMLRGLVRCSCCGSTLTQTLKGKALQCHKYASGQCRISHYITLDTLNRAVLGKMEADQKDEILEILLTRVQNSAPAELSHLMLDREYRRLERIKAAYADGIDSLEEYKLNKSIISGRIQKLEQSPVPPGPPDAVLTRAFQKRLRDLIHLLNSPSISETAKNMFLRSFISSIEFNRTDNTVRIFYYI